MKITVKQMLILTEKFENIREISQIKICRGTFEVSDKRALKS